MLDSIDEAREITVYRADLVWSKHKRWFMVPQDDLRRLYVASYLVHPDSDGDVGPKRMEKAAQELYTKHGVDAVLIGIF